MSEPQPSNPSNTNAEEPATDANSSANQCGAGGNPSTGKPVIIATGEKLLPEQDFAAGSTYGLPLNRTYRSFNTGDRMLGKKWMSDYDFPTLTFSGCWKHPDYGNLCIPQSVVFTHPDGSAYTYKRTSALGGLAYVAKNSSATGRFVYTPYDSWQLTRNQTKYQFSTAGLIQSVGTIGGGTLITFTYGSNPQQVTKVTNISGQSVAFTWSNNRVAAVTDPAGQQWTYGYDANGMLATVTSPGAPASVRTYHYENAADRTLLTGVSIDGVRYSTYKYFADRRVQESGLEGGETRDTFSYGTNQTTVTDAKGQPATYTFGAVQGALKLTGVSRAATGSCAATAAQTAYDANGWTDYTLDWNGNKTDYSHDLNGKLLEVTSAAGTAHAQTSTNTWSGNDLVATTFKDSNNTAYAKVSYTYLASGLATGKLATQTLTDLRSGQAQTTSYSYAYHPNKVLATLAVARTLPSGMATTTYQYDTLGNLISVTNPAGHTATYSSYNGLGLPGRMTDANGLATDYGYDARGNLVNATQQLPSGPRTVTSTYNGANQPLDITDPTGAVARLRYNAALRLNQVGNAFGEYTTLPYDTPTNTTQTRTPRHTPGFNGATPVATAAGEFVATSEQDSLGRPWKLKGNNGQQVAYTYDGNGNVKTRTDAAGRVTRYDHDALNRLTLLTAADGGTTRYGYDLEGNLATVTDPRGLVTRYAYNGFGELTQRVSPDTGTTSYSYDSAGRQTSETRANGSVINYTYDALNRLTSRTAAGVTESFTYDEGAYGKGRLSRLNDATGSTVYAYHPDGSLASQTNTLYGNVFTTTWSYNAAGQLATLRYPNGTVLSYSHDAYGRLSRIGSDVAGWPTLADSFLYQPATEQRYAWRFGNNLPRARYHDSDGRLTQVYSPGAQNLTYGWNPTNTLSSITDHAYGGQNAGFAYDAADRLTTASRNNGDDQGFGLDAVGNRTAHSRAGQSWSFSLDPNANRLFSASGSSARTFGYDSVGNLASDSQGC